MDYKKRCKELVRAIEQLQESNPSDENIQNWANGTLYGTEETDDERIRQNCIHFLELQKSHHAATFEIEECIAWLEKQTPVKFNDEKDEKIRKELLESFKYQQRESRTDKEWLNGIKLSEVVSWLEKQDFYYTFEIKKGHWYKCVCDYMLNGSDLMFKNGRLYYCRSDWRLESEIDERNVKDIGVHGYKSFFRPATNQEIKDWLEKQGETSPVLSNSLNIGKENEGKISPKWSKEDEEEFIIAIETLHEAGQHSSAMWLKSIKQRIAQ